jgi:hypothetical protein
MKKKSYIAPSLTTVSFHTERGYALSLTIEQSINPIDNYIEVMMLDNNDYHETETFIEHNDWHEDDRGAFWN